MTLRFRVITACYIPLKREGNLKMAELLSMKTYPFKVITVCLHGQGRESRDLF